MYQIKSFYLQQFRKYTGSQNFKKGSREQATHLYGVFHARTKSLPSSICTQSFGACIFIHSNVMDHVLFRVIFVLWLVHVVFNRCTKYEVYLLPFRRYVGGFQNFKMCHVTKATPRPFRGKFFSLRQRVCHILLVGLRKIWSA